MDKKDNVRATQAYISDAISGAQRDALSCFSEAKDDDHLVALNYLVRDLADLAEDLD